MRSAAGNELPEFPQQDEQDGGHDRGEGAEGATTHIEGMGVDVHPRIETGDAAGVLLDLSEEAELMVVGSRGRGGFVGSTAYSPALDEYIALAVLPREQAKEGVEVEVVYGEDVIRAVVRDLPFVRKENESHG